MHPGNQIIKSGPSFILLISFVLVCCLPKSSDNSAAQNEEITDNNTIKVADISDIDLFDKELIGSVKAGANTWLIVSGATCEECDENISIFIYPKSSPTLSDQLKNKYSYPGREYHYLNDSLIYESRVFWGSCLPSYSNVIVWLQKELMDDGKWKNGAYLIEFKENELLELRIDYTSDLLSDVLEKVNSSICNEIAGIRQTSEP